jgi:hypothetical protein
MSGTEITPELDARAYRLNKDGYSARSIARGLGTSHAAVPNMVQRHERRMRGETVPSTPRKWTKAEDTIIRENRQCSIAELARLTGRPFDGVTARLSLLGIRKFPKPKVEALFAGDEDVARARQIANIKHLVDLKKAGYSPTMTGDRPYTPVRNPIVFGAMTPLHPRSATGSHAAMCEGF